MIVSFAWTQTHLLKGVKSRTSRVWKNSHHDKFKRGMIVDAWSHLPFAGGRKIATIELACDAYYESISEISATDVEKEGWPGMTPEQWLKEVWVPIGRSPDDRVSVIEFSMRSVFMFAKLGTLPGARIEAMIGSLPRVGEQFDVVVDGRPVPVQVNMIDSIGGHPFYFLDRF